MVSALLVAALAMQQQAALPLRGAPITIDLAALRHRDGRMAPLMTAVRAIAATPRIDGRLDDAAWNSAEPATEFRQRSPRDGDAATQRTEVRILYDNEAVYIGARMFDSEPARIAAQLGRRDDLGASDYFQVAFDSYHDHLTSFQFYVNPLGVKMDYVASGDFSFGDTGWDPVWEVATQRDSLGWTAEFRIPLSQLRFSGAATQIWGVNFERYVQRAGENSWWSYVPQTQQGYASAFGHILGLADLPQPRRLEVMPYVAGIEDRTDPGAPNNPFNDGSREVGRVGLDLQYGLTSNLTLNATVNPDFGQVEADPAEVNLTAYETYFMERRPFFVEGADIFRAVSPGNIPVNGPEYLYSRRIGRSPQGSAQDRGDGGFVDQPSNTTILGATKLSGRTGSGWSLGFLDAVTSREYATVDVAGEQFRDQVEPLTNYGVFRAKRDFRSGASTVGFTATSVNRRIDDARLDFLRTAAYAGGLDFHHRFAGNRFMGFATAGYSSIEGDTLAIQAAQRSSARYYQRPDADYVSYDPARTSLAGWNAAAGVSEEAGATKFAVGFQATSPGFEINDLGYQSRADRMTAIGKVVRLWTQPGRVFRQAQLQAMTSAGWNFGGNRTSTQASVMAYGQFVNFWNVNGGLNASLRATSDVLTRGGPLASTLAGLSGNLCASSDTRRSLRVHAGTNFARRELGGSGLGFHLETEWQPSPRILLAIGPSFYASREPLQFVTSSSDVSASETFGRSYLFAEISQRTLDLTTRLNVTLTPALSVQLYVQPFVATGDYRDFKELTAPRSRDYLVYGQTAGSTLTPLTDAAGAVTGYTLDPDGAGPRPATQFGNPNFSSRSLRGNAVLRWEYRPGSTLFFVWTTNCSAYESDSRFDAVGDVGRLCQGRAANVFAVKLNYWLSL
jgi:hypothetical protein